MDRKTDGWMACYRSLQWWGPIIRASSKSNWNHRELKWISCTLSEREQKETWAHLRPSMDDPVSWHSLLCLPSLLLLLSSIDNKAIPYNKFELPINDGIHGASALSSPSNDGSAPSRQDQPTSSSSNQEIVRRTNNLNNNSIQETRTRNGGLAVSSHQTPSKDAQERLILDCFLHLLSFLPPESIATTEAVSSRWRNEIRSSGSLHQEMNLMRLGLEVPIKDFISHFRRLSLLAHHRLVKVSLNMSSCWADYLWRGKNYDNTECHQLFENLLFGSKYSLREVSLVFRLDGRFFHEFNRSFFPLVN